MADKLKKIVLIHVPMPKCNFRCSYCYLSHQNHDYAEKIPEFRYSPEHVGIALSQQRLGGVCYINICAEGETLLTPNIEKYVFELLKQGHYIEFVTNCTVTPVLDKLLSFPKEMLARIEFKCSFHYLELKRKNLLDTFASNVKKIWASGASANIEITPCDELIPHLQEVKDFSLQNFGALPHITIARNDATDGIEYLTKLPLQEYDAVWSQFDSDFWEFKKSIFLHHRNEFCYAGAWSIYVNLATGIATQCYCSTYKQNVFENLKKGIVFKPIGKCSIPHCYNGHSLLTLGCIASFTETRYGDIRNRVRADGTEWLQAPLKDFFNFKLEESNEELSRKEKAAAVKYAQRTVKVRKALQGPKKFVKTILLRK